MLLTLSSSPSVTCSFLLVAISGCAGVPNGTVKSSVLVVVREQERSQLDSQVPGETLRLVG